MDGPWIQTGIALALLIVLGSAVLVAARIPALWSLAAAIARAIVQLAALSLIPAGVITDLRWVALGLVVMFVSAVGTAARRSRTGLRSVGPLALAMLVGPTVVGAAVFGSGAVEFSPRYLLAILSAVLT
ncbi:MAG: ABC transporter permease [Pseudolysinimonas sp.]